MPTAAQRLSTPWLPLVLVLSLSGSLAAQEPERVETLVVHAHAMEHQPAREALPLIETLLSPAGSLELRTATNTLVIRDRASVIERIQPVLREFDHPPRQLTLEIFLVEASRPPAGGGGGGDELPESLARGLGRMLQFNRYRLLGQGVLEAREGDHVSYALGGGYEVSFRIGTLLAGQRLRLRGFQISRRGGEVARSLLHADLNLNVERMYVLSVARDESSDSGLVVAVSCTPEVDLEKPRVGGS
ncbi:MAG TPA: hypothetical protein VMV46_20865 [Thermoanaerobaculia bacterium]|nr:hypothetical protein [Thermoanaerobaculia bacterium]